MADKTSAAPKGYVIADNKLYRKMMELYGMYREIGAGKYHSIIVIGPPGVGKTRGADQYLSRGGATRVVHVRPNADNMIDILFQFRHKHIVLVFDDTDFVWNSEPSLGILKIVAEATGKREIADPRKSGHGRFVVNCRFCFITNKPIHDPELKAYPNSMRPHIEAMKSRFQLQPVLSFAPLDCFHFACWIATDGMGLLREVQFEGRRLPLDAANEVLAWFAENYNRLTEVSPRTLVDNIAQYRLKSPDVWQSLAEQWCTAEPRQIIVGVNSKGHPIYKAEATPAPWVIQRPQRPQQADNRRDDNVITLPAIAPAPAKKVAAKKVAAKKVAAKKVAAKKPVKLVRDRGK